LAKPMFKDIPTIRGRKGSVDLSGTLPSGAECLQQDRFMEDSLLLTRGVTYEKGNYIVDLRPGVYDVQIEKEGYAIVKQSIQVSDESKSINIAMHCISKGYIKIENERLRSAIRSSTNIGQITNLAKLADHVVDLASRELKKFANKQSDKTSKHAHKRIEEIRKLEGSLSFRAGSDSIEFSKSEKKSRP
jgi:hypothetical protein